VQASAEQPVRRHLHLAEDSERDRFADRLADVLAFGLGAERIIEAKDLGAVDPQRRVRRRPPFPIARISTSHAFAHSHDHLRRLAVHTTEMRQNMTVIISISPECLPQSPHKFVNVMA